MYEKIIIVGIIASVFGLMAPQIIQAQGTMTYLSNLGQSSAGSNPVGSNSWYAMFFSAGNNTAGYTLDSVQLALADATGNPGGFTAMIYSVVWTSGPFPGSSLGTLAGSLSPISAGIYSYAPTTSFTLPPNTPYFLVLTAETAVSNGAYEWDYANSPSYNPIGGWGWGDAESSVDGTSWNPRGSYFQFAINATAVPEPCVFSLFVLGGLCFLWHRRKKVD